MNECPRTLDIFSTKAKDANLDFLLIGGDLDFIILVGKNRSNLNLLFS